MSPHQDDGGDALACPVCGATTKSTGEPFTERAQVEAHVSAKSDDDHKGIAGKDVRADIAEPARSSAASRAGSSATHAATPGGSPSATAQLSREGSSAAIEGATRNDGADGPPPLQTDADVQRADAADGMADADGSDGSGLLALSEEELEEELSEAYDAGFADGRREALEEFGLIDPDDVDGDVLVLPCGHATVDPDDVAGADEVRLLGGDRVVNIICDECDGGFSINLDAEDPTPRRVG